MNDKEDTDLWLTAVDLSVDLAKTLLALSAGILTALVGLLKEELGSGCPWIVLVCALSSFALSGISGVWLLAAITSNLTEQSGHKFEACYWVKAQSVFLHVFKVSRSYSH